MKTYCETSGTRIDSILCAIVVAVALGSVAFAAIGQAVGTLVA